MKIALLLIILLLFLFFFLFPTMIMSCVIYCVLFYRKNPEKWARECSMPEDKEIKSMFEIGKQWSEENKSYKIEVETHSDGLKLAGEYYNFGYDKAVIIIAGRMESCLYSCYFAKPYKEAGYNVLVIDNRAHGWSEGKISSLGYKEYRDILSWGELLNSQYGIEDIILHGICIGASTALFTLTSKNCPNYFKALVTEGMYSTFYHSFNNHMKLDKRPIFPFSLEVMLWIAIISGGNALTDGPIKRISKLDRPALFLHSRVDQFSSPNESEKVYNKCKSTNKVVWFDKGLHSKIRINNTELYDETIKEFLNTNYYYNN